MIFDVSDLMQLAALDDRVIEHVDHRLAQRLGPVDADQHRAGDVQAPLPQVHQQVGDQRGVLRGALHQRQRMLVPVDVDAQSHDAARLGEVHPVDHQRHQIQPGQIRGEQLGQGGFGHRHKPAGDRRLACRRTLFGDLLPDRLKPDRVAAGREPGQHLLHRHLAQDLRRAEQLIGRDRQLTRSRRRPAPAGGSPAPGAHPGSPTRARGRAAPPCAPRRGLPFGPANAVTSASINAAITCRPAPTASASRPSPMFSAISVIATLTRSGTADALASTG